MGYIEDETMVRVDFFKRSGKWSHTIGMKWIGYDGYIFDEFKRSLRSYFNDKVKLGGMTAVCLEPYNRNAHPIMIDVLDIWEDSHE